MLNKINDDDDDDDDDDAAALGNLGKNLKNILFDKGCSLQICFC